MNSSEATKNVILLLSTKWFLIEWKLIRIAEIYIFYHEGKLSKSWFYIKKVFCYCLLLSKIYPVQTKNCFKWEKTFVSEMQLRY